jgi:hypothetical protein
MKIIQETEQIVYCVAGTKYKHVSVWKRRELCKYETEVAVRVCGINCRQMEGLLCKKQFVY